MVDEMTDKSLIINLTAGLRMEYNSVTSKSNKDDDMTPDDARKELLEHGVRIEHQLANEIKNDTRPSESAAFVAAAATASNVELSKQVSKLTALIAGMRRGRGKPRRQGFKGNCFECGGERHVQKDCPNRQDHDPEDHEHASGFPAVAFPSVACFDWAYDDVQYNFDRDSLAEKSWPHEWPGEAPSLVPRISEYSETCDLLQVMGDDVLPDASRDTTADAATERARRNRRRCTRRKTKAEAKEPLSVHVEEYSLPESKNAATATCATPAAPDTWFFPGGKVKPGEDDNTTMCRELKEETGLIVRIDFRLAKVKAYEYKDDNHNNHTNVLYTGDLPMAYLLAEDSYRTKEHARDMGNKLRGMRHNGEQIPAFFYCPVAANTHAEIVDNGARMPCYNCFSSFAEIMPVSEVQSFLEIDVVDGIKLRGYRVRFPYAETKMWEEAFAIYNNPKTTEELDSVSPRLTGQLSGMNMTSQMSPQLQKVLPKVMDSIDGTGDHIEKLFPAIKAAARTCSLQSGHTVTPPDLI